MSTSDPTASGERPLDHRDATFYRVPRRRRPLLAVFGWFAFVLLTVGGATLLFAERYANYALSNPANDSVEIRNASMALSAAPKNLSDKPLNVLVIGSDVRPEDGGGGRSDTIILFRLDFKREFISQLSFPRDLYVQIPGHGPDKINAAYSVGETKLVIETVKKLTGETDIPYVFNVDFDAFRQLVNDSGGVWLDIDRHYFNDNSGRDKYEPLNIPPGYQRLSGADALDYVRYRHGDSDFGRIARQQLFLAELKRETRGARGLDNVVDAVHKHVSTNLDSPNRLRQLLQFGLGVEKGRIARTQIESSGGRTLANGQAVVDTTDALIQKAVERWRNPEFVQQTASGAKTAAPTDVLVSVYNGTPRLNLGLQVGKALEKKGYRVYVGNNAPSSFPSTVVYYTPGREAEARALAVQFGPNATTGQKREGMDADMDLVVMVGADYSGIRKPAAPKKSTVKPDTVTTLSLKPIVQRFRRDTKVDALVPMKLPRGAEVVYVRRYNIERGDLGTPNALTMVLRLPGYSTYGGSGYVTITQTSMKDPPIVKTTETEDRQGMRTWYDGKNMQRLLWTKGKTTYWITNSLDMKLTAATIRDMQTFMVRPANAKLKKGQSDNKVKITEKGRTP